jgi:hypothetical protein
VTLQQSSAELAETDNPGALKWLKKNDEIGMLTAIKDVVNALASLRQSTPHQIASLVQTNFSRLIANDPCVRDATEFPNAIVKK